MKRQLHTRVRKPFINNTLSIHYHFSEKFLNAYGKNGRSKRKLSHTFANATRTKHRCTLNNTMKIAAEVFLASSQRKLIYLQHKKEKINKRRKQKKKKNARRSRTDDVRRYRRNPRNSMPFHSKTLQRVNGVAGRVREMNIEFCAFFFFFLN